MSKQFLLHDEARAAILRGMNIAADIVGSTLSTAASAAPQILRVQTPNFLSNPPASAATADVLLIPASLAPATAANGQTPPNPAAHLKCVYVKKSLQLSSFSHPKNQLTYCAPFAAVRYALDARAAIAAGASLEISNLKKGIYDHF